MPKLEEDLLRDIISAMFDWESTTLESLKINVNNSWPVQIFGLLSNINYYCPDMDNFTYDLMADSEADEKGFDSIWYALAYYLAKYQGVSNEREAHEFAHVFNKSIKSGVANLQAIALCAKIRLYAGSHDLDGKNINVITFDGGYDMKRGNTISEASSLML